MKQAYTIIEGVTCQTCGRPVLLIATQWNMGESVIIGFQCIENCGGVMKQQMYPVGLRMKEG